MIKGFLDVFSLEEIEYQVAHRGLFQRAPIPEVDDPEEYPSLWRAVLDRSLLDYIKGPDQVGQKVFSEVSAWLKVPIEQDDPRDFEEVCDLSHLDHNIVRGIFTQCRYEKLSKNDKE